MSDDDMECFGCRICSNTFSSLLALKNHAMNKHFEVYEKGDPGKWTGLITVANKPTKKPKTGVESEAQKLVLGDDTRAQIAEDVVLSAMFPAPLITLASADVSMIILREDDDDFSPAVRQKKSEKKLKPRILRPGYCYCPVCNRGFVKPFRLHYHIKTEHNMQVFKYICDVCGAAFNKKSAHKRHMCKDHKEEPFPCPECEKKFGSYDLLKRHYLAHDKSRPYWCDICKKTFTEKTDLEKHYTVVHSLSKPYQCELCERSFSEESSLKIHMKATHKTSNNYFCKFCSNPFNNSQDLTLHVRTVHQENQRRLKGTS